MLLYFEVMAACVWKSKEFPVCLRKCGPLQANAVDAVGLCTSCWVLAPKPLWEVNSACSACLLTVLLYVYHSSSGAYDAAHLCEAGPSSFTCIFTPTPETAHPLKQRLALEAHRVCSNSAIIWIWLPDLDFNCFQN